MNVLRRIAYELLRALGSFEPPVGRHPAAIRFYGRGLSQQQLVTIQMYGQGDPDE